MGQLVRPQSASNLNVLNHVIIRKISHIYVFMFFHEPIKGISVSSVSGSLSSREADSCQSREPTVCVFLDALLLNKDHQSDSLPYRV